MSEPEYLDADGDPMVFPPGTPDEIKERVAEQARRMGTNRALMEARFHDFLTGLGLEDLRTMRILLAQINRDPKVGLMLEGVTVGLLAAKGEYGIMMEPALLGKTDFPGMDRVRLDVPDVIMGVESTPGEARPALEEEASSGSSSGEATDSTPAIHPDALAAMGDESPDVPNDISGIAPSPEETLEKYNVKRKDGDPVAVVCLGCGMEYESLADRMLRAPDHCTGCHSKAAWG